METLQKILKKPAQRCTFWKNKVEITELLQLDAADYIDLYFGDASHFSTVANVPYAWHKKNESILLPSIRSKSLSVLGYSTR